MNQHDSANSDCKECRSRCAYVLAVLGALLIVAALVFAMKHYIKTPPLGQARAEERAQKLKELRAEEESALKEIGWVDQAKGTVRLPINVAMELELREWQNPAAGRAKLIERIEKATFVPPPPPAKPSEFE